jgi:hypothetical protein
MKLRMYGQIYVEHAGHFLQIRPGGVDEDWRIDLLSRMERDPGHALILHVHIRQPRRLETDSLSASHFEQIHAKLLGAQPAGTPDVQCGHGLFGQIGEMLVDKIGAEQQIGASGRVVKAFGMCGPIGRGAGGVNAQRSRAQARDPQGSGLHFMNPGLIGRHIQVAAAVQAEDIAALPGKLFHPIDGAVHQRQHLGIGPPVAIALGGTVACK